MLDAFEIVTTAGVVLWSRSTTSIGSTLVNSLINDVFIEERVRPQTGSSTGQGLAPKPTYKHEKYTLKWTLVKDLGLIFVAVYQSLLHLTWVDKLLENISTIFVNIYKEPLKAPNANIRDYPFDPYFDQQLRELDTTTGTQVAAEPPGVVAETKKVSSEEGDTGGPPPPPVPGLLKAQPRAVPANGDSGTSTPVQSPDSSRPTTPIPGHLVTGKTGPGGRSSRRARKAATASANASDADESRKAKTTKAPAKKGRVWGPDGLAGEEDGTTLDYSANGEETNGDAGPTSAPVETIRPESWGTKTNKGQFVLKGLDDEVTAILNKSKADAGQNSTGTNDAGTSSFASISSYFRNIIGGKALTKPDLDKPLKAMEEHLLRKNVAREAALRLCAGVEASLLNTKLGPLQSIDSLLLPAMEASLTRILTPTTSLDLLREIQSVSGKRPYVISIVGVNGVGKSTNLSKIAYFLLQNSYRVLIAACDTFRAGAVEQLHVHVRNLKQLAAREHPDSSAAVDLYQKGYGKDAASVARDAVAYAVTQHYDVVLIDTAGRRHNDARLMSSLAPFAAAAQPDKILMVGEALVGTDSVAQARHFDAAFGPGRGLDGFIISKCDTVGDMVGTLVSMVHATAVPVLFLGVGQHYGDLRGLSVPWAVRLLMA